MAQRNVVLTPHFDRFIDAEIEAGRFSHASEIVQEGLRLLEQREREDEARLAWLQGAAADTFASLDRGEGLRVVSADALDALVPAITEPSLSERS